MAVYWKENICFGKWC